MIGHRVYRVYDGQSAERPTHLKNKRKQDELNYEGKDGRVPRGCGQRNPPVTYLLLSTGKTQGALPLKE